MTLREFLSEGWYGISIFCGAICGVGAVYSEAAPVLALVGILVIGIGIYVPTLTIAFMYFGIATDVGGMIGIDVLGLPLTISKLGVLLALFCYLVNTVMRGKSLFRFNWLLFSLVMVVASMTASVAVSGMPGPAFRFIMGVAMLTVMVALIDSGVEKAHLPDLVKFMAFMIILLGLWAVLNRHTAVIFRLDHAWQERNTGTFGDPNFWALFLVVSCPIMVASLVEEDTWTARGLLLGVLVCYPLLVVGSYSRAGLLGMLVTGPGIAFLLRKHWQMVLVVVVMIIPLIPFVVNVDAAILRYGTLFNPGQEAELGHASLSERTMLLYAGIDLIKAHPITGIGVGMFPTYASYVTAGGVWKVAHNTYITIWVEQGLIGVVTHLFLFANILYTGYRGAWHGPTPYYRAISVGFLVGMAGAALMALTLNVMDFSPIYYCMGIGLIAESTTRRAPEHVHLQPVLEVR